MISFHVKQQHKYSTFITETCLSVSATEGAQMVSPGHTSFETLPTTISNKEIVNEFRREPFRLSPGTEKLECFWTKFENRLGDLLETRPSVGL